MADTITREFLTAEKVTVNGKGYIKKPSAETFEDILKNKPGSFINILANSLSTGKAPGKSVSYWK